MFFLKQLKKEKQYEKSILKQSLHSDQDKQPQ